MSVSFQNNLVIVIYIVNIFIVYRIQDMIMGTVRETWKSLTKNELALTRTIFFYIADIIIWCEF